MILDSPQAVDQMYQRSCRKSNLWADDSKAPKQHRDGSYSFYFAIPTAIWSRLCMNRRSAAEVQRRLMANLDQLSQKSLLSLVPWCWVQLESGNRRDPSFGRGSEVVAGLHRLIAFSQVDRYRSAMSFKTGTARRSHRGPLEDAYAERVNTRPYLRQHIRCGRR